MEKAYKFRIYPNKQQSELIAQTFGCKRWVYNHFLAERIEVYEKEKRTIGRFEQDKRLTRHKKEIEWLRVPDKCALQNALVDLDTAYQNFFRRVKRGEKPGFPKFKSKRNRCQSYRTNCTNNNIKLFDKNIQLPKLGRVECRVSKQIEGRIISATVSQNPSGKCFVSVVCTDIEVKPLEKTESVVGVDLGLKDLAITSDGQLFTNPKHFTKSQKKLAKLQHKLSRKQKGSNNREKARVKVARLHEHIANQRLDNAHKLTSELVRNHDLIAIETLAPQNMVKNRRLAKAIGDAGWGEIARQLEYKCAWYGKELVKVDRFFPSSQACNACGFKNIDAKKLSVREWDCPECKTHHDRDINAAKNILGEGLRVLSVA